MTTFLNYWGLILYSCQYFSYICNMKRAYKYRIYPTEEQKKYFAVSFAANRWFWNYALGKIQTIFDANKGKEEKERIPSVQYEIARELPLLKKEESTSWIKEADAMSFIYTSQNLDEALKKFWQLYRV